MFPSHKVPRFTFASTGGLADSNWLDTRFRDPGTVACFFLLLDLTGICAHVNCLLETSLQKNHQNQFCVLVTICVNWHMQARITTLGTGWYNASDNIKIFHCELLLRSSRLLSCCLMMLVICCRFFFLAIFSKFFFLFFFFVFFLSLTMHTEQSWCAWKVGLVLILS